VNPDRLAELKEERAFLLESIRDIDHERAAGDMDEADHAALRDGYVARAAAVLREIEDGRSSLLARRAVPWWRRVATLTVTLGLAVALGLLVARMSGQRVPGQTITGGAITDEVTALLSDATQIGMSDPAAAIEKYARVLEIEPDNVEAITYSSWLAIQSARQIDDPDLIRSAVPGLERAIELDPDYANAHCFLAITLARYLEPVDVDTARDSAERCLEANPPGALRGQIDALVAELSPTPST